MGQTGKAKSAYPILLRLSEEVLERITAIALPGSKWGALENGPSHLVGP